jgi:hypothetical protein
MATAESCIVTASPQLRRVSNWCAWQAEILVVLAEELGEVLGDVHFADVDWSAWQPLFEEGRSARAAVARAFERDL